MNQFNRHSASVAPDSQAPAWESESCARRFPHSDSLPKGERDSRVSPHDFHGNGGFSLVELMTVMAVALVILLIGVPSYQSFITANNVTSEINSLTSDLQYARSEAVKQGQAVQICAANTSGNGPYACSNSTTWTNGWIICLAANCANANLLRVQKPMTSGDTLISASATALSAITFNYFGFSNLKGSVTVSPRGGTGSLKTLCISSLGNLQKVTGDDTQCP